jgi:DNA-binding response OmpR family regulator
MAILPAPGLRWRVENPIIILLVEDEQLIVLTIEEAFTAGGFALTSVASGTDAIRELEKPDTAYRALVTDIHLRDKVTGWDVAKRAREVAPDMAVVYMSGAAAAEWSAHGVPHSVLVTKPFAPAQLVTAVSQLLNKADTPGT